MHFLQFGGLDVARARQRDGQILDDAAGPFAHDEDTVGEQVMLVLLALVTVLAALLLWLPFVTIGAVEAFPICISTQDTLPTSPHTYTHIYTHKHNKKNLFIFSAARQTM